MYGSVSSFVRYALSFKIDFLRLQYAVSFLCADLEFLGTKMYGMGVYKGVGVVGGWKQFCVSSIRLPSQPILITL